MRNLCEAVRRADHDAVKRDAQRIYQAASQAAARKAFERFRFRWRAKYSPLLRRLEQDLPALLTFFEFPRTCGANCAQPMLSSDALSRCDGERDRWSCSAMSKAWIESSMRFSAGSMRTGKPTPSNYLHRQLDVTVKRLRLTARAADGIKTRINNCSRWGRGAVGSAPRWHRGGRGFESHRLHQFPDSPGDSAALLANHPSICTPDTCGFRKDSFGSR